MEKTTTILVEDLGAITLLIDKDALIKLLQNKNQFIIVKKKTTIVAPYPYWSKDSKNITTIERIAINKRYIVQML
jgi:hypothetical protein